VRVCERVSESVCVGVSESVKWLLRTRWLLDMCFGFGDGVVSVHHLMHACIHESGIV